jgi:Ti type entry exclusion protein TrbK
LVSRAVIIVIVLLAAAAGSAPTVLVIQAEEPGKTAMSQEQRDTPEKFFGSSKELRPIEKGQELRPRW